MTGYAGLTDAALKSAVAYTDARLRKEVAALRRLSPRFDELLTRALALDDEVARRAAPESEQ